MDSHSPGSEPKSGNRDYCFRHAQMYQGWECPRCASEDADTPAQQAHGSTPAGGAGGPAAAGGQSGAIVTPQSRSASLVRSEEAQHLLDAGSPSQALEACARALDLDPENLHAHAVAARAAGRVGEYGEQAEHLEEGARLLGQPVYRRSVKWYHELVKSARDAAMARPVVGAFLASGPWEPPDTVSMVRTLVGRDFTGEALRVIESVPTGQRSLALCAYSAQLTKRGFGINDPEVDAYLAAVPSSGREEVLREVREMCDSPAFSRATLQLIRDAVRLRHRSWQPEIREGLEASAREALAARLAPEVARPAFAVALRTGGAALVALVVLTVALGLGILLFLLGLLLVIGAAAAGFAHGREAELRKRVDPLLPGSIEELSRREEEAWQLILDDRAEPFAIESESQEPGPAEPGPPEPGPPEPV